MLAICATSTWLPLFLCQCVIMLILHRAWDWMTEVNGYRIFTYTAMKQAEKKKESQAEACNPLILLLYSGADCRDRTGHLMITNQLLYQMS